MIILRPLVCISNPTCALPLGQVCMTTIIMKRSWQLLTRKPSALLNASLLACIASTASICPRQARPWKTARSSSPIAPNSPLRLFVRLSRNGLQHSSELGLTGGGRFATMLSSFSQDGKVNILAHCSYPQASGVIMPELLEPIRYTLRFPAPHTHY